MLKSMGRLLLDRHGTLINLQRSMRYLYQREKISLFRAHQNRLIQDKESEDVQIKLSNCVKKVDPNSQHLTSLEIENFDIYYGRFESVVCEGTGQHRRIVRSLKKYDVDMIIRRKLKEDYETIVLFLKERNVKMKSNEYIYILSYFFKNKDRFMQLLEEEMSLFADVIVKGLSSLNIYSSVDFVRLQKLVFLFDIKDDDVWKNFLIKGNLLFANNSELENVLTSLFQVFKIFLAHEFRDYNSQSVMIQLKKKLLKGLSSIDLHDCVELFSLIANKSVFVDPNQINLFQERFISNKEILTIEQFAVIFDAMAKLNNQSSDLPDYFIKYQFNHVRHIIPSKYPLLLNAIEQHTEQMQVELDNHHNEIHNEDKTHITIDTFTKLVNGFSSITTFSVKLAQEVFNSMTLSVKRIKKKHVYVCVKMMQSNSELWMTVERMLERYVELYGKKGEIDRILKSEEIRILIGCFEGTQQGTCRIWLLLSNRGEMNLSYSENYVILKNLCRYDEYNLQQLNLALSYILDETSDLPKFQLILVKESALKIVEKIEVYALVIYKYIEDAEQNRGINTVQNELVFQKKCMKELLKESVNALLKGQDKKWKDLDENSLIKLYGLLHLCEFKSNYSITQDIAILERSISKQRKTYSMKQVAFLTLMQESFASKEQYDKWSNFIFSCIQNASQLEFTTYFTTFYIHRLSDLYLWSLLLVKYIQLIELFPVNDLLSFMLVFLKKLHSVDQEIWELFIEVVKIKAVKDHLEHLQLFASHLDNTLQRQDLIDVITELNSLHNSDELEQHEVNYIEQMGLSFKEIANNTHTLSVHKAHNIKSIIHLIN